MNLIAECPSARATAKFSLEHPYISTDSVYFLDNFDSDPIPL